MNNHTCIHVRLSILLVAETLFSNLLIIHEPKTKEINV